jgi:hypothetical protein
LLLATQAWIHPVLGILMDIGIIFMEVKAKPFHQFKFKWTPPISIASASSIVTGILSFSPYMRLALDITGMDSPGFKDVDVIWG